MKTLLYVVAALAFLIGIMIAVFSSALVGSVYFVVTVTAAAGAGIIDAVERKR